jgi:DNA (cytosine-5)-methyltransferase 1
MFFEVQRIIKDHLRSVDGFILENVEGLVTHDMRDEEIYEENGNRIGRTLATILHILRVDLNFNVSWAVLNAADYGVPQRRKRIYIVGCKKKYGEINLEFEKQLMVGTRDYIEHGLPCIDNEFSRALLSRYRPKELYGKALKDKRGGARNIHSWDIEKKGPVSDSQKELLNRLVCERRQHRWADIIGIEWMDGMPLTEQQIASFFPHPDLHQMLEDLTQKQYLVLEHPKQRVWHSDASGNRWSTRVPDESKPKGYNIVTGKLSFEISSILDPEKPVNTIVAMDMSTIGVIDDEGIRHLTLREGLRLFGYPETYDLDFFYNEKDGVNNGYDLLGNSVCVPVIKMIADRLVQKLYIK